MLTRTRTIRTGDDHGNFTWKFVLNNATVPESVAAVVAKCKEYNKAGYDVSPCGIVGYQENLANRTIRLIKYDAKDDSA